jgi:anti-anti-sigma factor
MSATLTLDTTRLRDGRTVLTAAGEIDLSNINVFRQALAEAIPQAASAGAPVTVDLSAVEYLDSAAINALYDLADRLHLIANPVLMRSLSVSGLAELVTIDLPPSVTPH